MGFFRYYLNDPVILGFFHVGSPLRKLIPKHKIHDIDYGIVRRLFLSAIRVKNVQVTPDETRQSNCFWTVTKKSSIKKKELTTYTMHAPDHSSVGSVLFVSITTWCCSFSRATRHFESVVVLLVGDGHAFHMANGTLCFHIFFISTMIIDLPFGRRENSKKPPYSLQ